MLRAPFNSRPSLTNPTAVPATHPAPDLFTDGDTPSLPSNPREGLQAASPIQVTTVARDPTRRPSLPGGDQAMTSFTT